MTVQKTVSETNESSPYGTLDFQPRLIDWNAVVVFAEKNMRIALRYPANLLVWGLMPLLWFAPFVLMMTAIAGPGTSAHFAEISGFDDFIKFSVIGWFVYMYVDNTIWSIGNNFRWEQFSGTLEPLFQAPVPRTSILLGAAISDAITTTISAFMLLMASCAVFGLEYSMTAIAPIIVIMLLMIMALFGFGFMVAGLILVFKDPSVLTQLVGNSLFTLSPVNYPIQALPSSAQVVAYLLPATIAIVTVRQLAITGTFGFIDLLLHVGALGAIIILFWILGLASFKYAEKWTKTKGSMGDF